MLAKFHRTKLIPDPLNILAIADQKITSNFKFFNKLCMHLSKINVTHTESEGKMSFRHFRIKIWSGTIFIILYNIFSHLWQINFLFYVCKNKTFVRQHTKQKQNMSEFKFIQSLTWVRFVARGMVLERHTCSLHSLNYRVKRIETNK